MIWDESFASVIDRGGSVLIVLPNVFSSRLIVALVVTYLALSTIFGVARNLCAPVQSIPGPWMNKASSVPLLLSMIRGKSHHFVRNLHTKYGPIVVLAPGTVAVSDAHAIKRIIQTEDWPKSYAIYGKFRQDENRPTIFAATEKKDHAARKRMMSSMFGIKHVRAMEPLMAGCVQAAVRKLCQACEDAADGGAGGVAAIDIQQVVQSVALDVMGITVFGDSFHTVENGSHPLPESMRKGMRLSALGRLLPWPIQAHVKQRARDYVERLSTEIIHTRRRNLESAQRRDLLQKFCEIIDDSPGSAFTFRDVQAESVLLLTAGSETTASAETFTLMNLVKHPGVMQKLVEEVDAWYPPQEASRETDCAYSMTGMVYLQACIDETMRLFPGQATGSARETAQDEIVLGYRLPKGTTVFPVTHGVHHDGLVWPEPHVFKPERWLDAREEGKVNELPYFPFSAGSRVCLGKHFALQEMHMTLVMLLRTFEFEYVPGQDEETVYMVAQRLRSATYMMRVRKRR